MSEREKVADTPDPGLIRLVSARYQQLQGPGHHRGRLLPAGLGDGLSAAFGGLARPPLRGVLVVYMWSRFTWIRRRLDSYYAHRYGRVGRSWRPNLAINLCIVISYGQILRDVGALDHRLLRRALHGGRNEFEPIPADLS